MGADQTAVNFGEVAAASKTIIGTSHETERFLDDLEKQIRHLEATWVGSASNEFQTTKAQWMKSANALRQTMTELGHRVGDSNDNYMANEDRIKKMFQ